MEESKYIVLIVDDDDFVREMIAEIFQGANFLTETVSNGNDALQRLSLSSTFDLVVSDMNMPEMNGLELLKEIRKNGMDIPLIILTGNEELTIAIEAMNNGANDYLLKDENIQDTILLSAKGVLEKHELKLQNRRLMDALIDKNKEIENSLIEVQNAYSELKKAQAQILQQEKMASIGQLAAGVAHEINNPMGFITTNIKMLEKYLGKLIEFISTQSDSISQLNSNKPVEVVEAKRSSLKIDYIIKDSADLFIESLQGAERVKKIVQALKNFSNVDATDESLSDINSGIEDTLSIMNNEFRDGINIHKDLGIIPKTVCSQGQLNQVFVNILLNAVQSIENHGEIAVKSWFSDGKIVTSFSDTGSGITKEHLPKIFDPFFTTKAVGKGQGLGLTVAYDIVKKHGGDITVVSEVGKGATFTISIPVVEVKS
jgi:two-component system NtrC family sensor kinase